MDFTLPKETQELQAQVRNFVQDYPRKSREICWRKQKRQVVACDLAGGLSDRETRHAESICEREGRIHPGG